MSKDVVVISPGALNIFWTIGAYYISDISDNYKVVLIIPDSYQDNLRFKKFLNKIKIYELITYNDKLTGYSKQKYLSNFFKNTILKYKPVAVIQNDYIGIDNMYLFHWSKTLNPQCQNIVILSYQPSENGKLLNTVMKELIEATAAKYVGHGLVNLLVKHMILSQKIFYSFFNNKFYPFLILRVRPYFPLSWKINADILIKKKLFDYFLVYEESTKIYLEDLFSENTQVEKIRFPAYVDHTINKVVYDQTNTPTISFFPSLLTIKSKNQEKNIYEWAKAIKYIKRSFPNHRYIFKFHPAYFGSEISKKIIAIFESECPFINFIDDPEVTAEELVLLSDVVVGDTSTTLMWAYFQMNKLVISLDLKDFSTSGSMKKYKGVIYIDDIDNLKNIDLNIQSNTFLFDDQRSILSNPSVAEKIMQIIHS